MISSGVSHSAEASTFRLTGEFQVGDFQLGLEHRDQHFDQEGWPSNFQTTSLTLGRFRMLESGKLLMIKVGAGAAADKNARTYTHVQPIGQLMYLSPPREGGKFGYMAGVMVAPESSPLPLLMLMYQPRPSVQVTVGVPMTSIRAELWEGARFDAVASLSGLQRLSLRQQLTDRLDLKAVYKEETARFGHVAAWGSDQVFLSQTRKLGMELEYRPSDLLTVGIEGGTSLRRRFERLSSGSTFSSEVLERQQHRGGYYSQLSVAVHF